MDLGVIHWLSAPLSAGKNPSDNNMVLILKLHQHKNTFFKKDRCNWTGGGRQSCWRIKVLHAWQINKNGLENKSSFSACSNVLPVSRLRKLKSAWNNRLFIWCNHSSWIHNWSNLALGRLWHNFNLQRLQTLWFQTVRKDTIINNKNPNTVISIQHSPSQLCQVFSEKETDDSYLWCFVIK